MYINHREALIIAEALHNPNAEACLVAGKVWPITTSMGKDRALREVTVLDIPFKEQDPSKVGLYAMRAKKGQKITWIGSKDQGFIADGKIERSCSVLLDSIRQHETPEIILKARDNDQIMDDCSRKDLPGEWDGESDRKLKKTKFDKDQLPVLSAEELHGSDSLNRSDNSFFSMSSSPKNSDRNETNCNTNNKNAFPVNGNNNIGYVSQSISTSTEGGNVTKSVPLVWQVEFRELVLQEEIGSGAYGKVKKALYRGTEVAVKILHSQLKTAEEMFCKEAELLFRLRHPNIVQCLGACTIQPNCCIVMELLPTNLSKLIKSGALQFDTMHQIALGIARGLNFLHCSDPQIIHRDLKPGNILLDSGFNPRIADFGVSREKSKNTLTMTRIGTPLYCAPEVLNNEHYSTKVDIYSYALLLYAMVNGGSPWKEEGLGPVQIMMKVARRERPKFPSSVRPDVAGLISQCWQHDPDLRPDALTIIAILEAVKGPTATSQGLDSTMVLPTIVTTMILPSPSFIPPDAGSHANPPPKFGAKNNTNDPISTNNSTASPALKVSKPIARSMSEVSASGEDADKQRCIFDSKSPRGCYQKNAEHLAKYSHPLGAYRKYCATIISENDTEITVQQKEKLNQFRWEKGITTTEHFQVMEEMKWSKADYERGERDLNDKKRKRF